MVFFCEKVFFPPALSPPHGCGITGTDCNWFCPASRTKVFIFRNHWVQLYPWRRFRRRVKLVRSARFNSCEASLTKCRFWTTASSQLKSTVLTFFLLLAVAHRRHGVQVSDCSLHESSVVRWFRDSEPKNNRKNTGSFGYVLVKFRHEQKYCMKFWTSLVCFT